MAIIPPISLKKIQMEFGGTGRLSEYVRGGALVTGNVNNMSISSTAIGLRLSSFLNAQKITNVIGLSISPTNLDSYETTSADSGTFYTNIYTFSGTDGSGSYSYSFTLVTGDNGANLSIAGNLLQVSFNFTGLLPTVIKTGSATIRCTVTDTSNGQSTFGEFVLTLDVERIGSSGL